ncbi:MAG TPA: hypothetical protein VIW01_12510 [Dehalococcoidia bacterium]
MAIFIFVETVFILAVAGAIIGDLLPYVVIGVLVGLGTMLSTYAAWRIGETGLRERGYRW